MLPESFGNPYSTATYDDTRPLLSTGINGNPQDDNCSPLCCFRDLVQCCSADPIPDPGYLTEDPRPHHQGFEGHQALIELYRLGAEHADAVSPEEQGACCRSNPYTEYLTIDPDAKPYEISRKSNNPWTFAPKTNRIYNGLRALVRICPMIPTALEKASRGDESIISLLPGAGSGLNYSCNQFEYYIPRSSRTRRGFRYEPNVITGLRELAELMTRGDYDYAWANEIASSVYVDADDYFNLRDEPNPRVSWLNDHNNDIAIAIADGNDQRLQRISSALARQAIAAISGSTPPNDYPDNGGVALFALDDSSDSLLSDDLIDRRHG